MRQERNKKSNRRDQLDRFELFCKCVQMIHTCTFFRKVATVREIESEKEWEWERKSKKDKNSLIPLGLRDIRRPSHSTAFVK